MVRALLRLLFPPKCAFCDKVVENDRFSVCEECLAKIAYNKRACKVCGTPLDTVYGELLCTACRKKRRSFTKAYVPLIYKETVREGILGMKFRGKRARAVTFAAFILLKLREAGAERPDVITYVPMHFIRLGQRGYNQARLMALALGDMLHVPVIKTLRKIKHTLPQSKRSGRDRLYALEGAFKAYKPDAFRGKTILLVDDVITTGASMNTCAKVLRGAGAKEIQVAAAAATPFTH